MSKLRIAEFRNLKGMSAAQMAERLGMSPGHYSHIERGLRPLTVDRLQEIARILEVEIDDLSVASPSSAPKRQPFERLAMARSRRFSTPKEAADSNGWEYHTYYAHETGKRTFGRSRALQYARALGVSADWLMLGRLAKVKPPPMIRVVGEVAAGVWIEELGDGSAPLDLDGVVTDDDRYVPGDPDYKEQGQFAVSVKGNSIDQIAQDGDILICMEPIGANISVSDGDVVIVDRRDGIKHEYSAKRLTCKGKQALLRAESSDPRYQEKITTDASFSDPNVKILGKVLRIMKKPPRPMT